MVENIFSQSYKKSSTNFYEILLNNLNEAVNLIDKDRMILFWNSGAEDLTGYSQYEMKGKRCQENLVIQTNDQHLVPCSKYCPVEKTLEEGRVQDLKAYIHHKEGYLLPVNLKAIPIKDKEDSIIGAIELFSETSPKVVLPHKTTALEQMNLFDPLTTMGNKKYLEQHLHSRLQEMKKFNLPFGVMFVDIDGLKKINSNYGSVVGDKILRMTAQTLANNIRFFEVVGRWEGQQFLVVLLNIDDTKLDLVANKLRLLVEQSNIREHDKLIGITISGGATIARKSDTTKSLISRAIKLTEQSKRLGKNRVSIRINED